MKAGVVLYTIPAGTLMSARLFSYVDVFKPFTSKNKMTISEKQIYKRDKNMVYFKQIDHKSGRIWILQVSDFLLTKKVV